ncbi:metallophosphoesterase, partial [Parabacteroides sp. OttesenSCG-928-G07]|nr:metallophosphoesterase [Parabacteroides sp. OttesenSCG-928-G07]
YIIILNHYPFQPFSKPGHTFLNNGDFVHPWNMIPEIIEAFRKKEYLEKEYENQFYENQPIFVDADFTNTPGNFVCYLGGHAHTTTHFEIKNLSNQSDYLPKQQMLLCTNQSPSESSSWYVSVERLSKSKSSNSFCIYSFDFPERKIYTTFFGAYKPVNKPDFPEIQEISF